ncbi:MAG: hypothetical protein KME45_32115 [Stenomitos rutilans HA7619-LM2]|jgi:hypothetical protein|nr:hypothetical protein [Stenomitos rutilans HA7619-LM2]
MSTRKQVKSPRPLCQRKQGKEGAKTLRGVPELYSERKQQFNATLTPQAITILEELALFIGESRSQVLEKAIRGEIDLLTLLAQRNLLPLQAKESAIQQTISTSSNRDSS